MKKKNIMYKSGLLVMSACIISTLSFGCQRVSSEAIPVKSNATTSNNATTTTGNVTASKKQTLVELPVLADELSLLIHAIVPINTDKSYSSKALLSSSSDDTDYVTGDLLISSNGFHKKSDFDYAVYAHNLIFEGVAITHKPTEQKLAEQQKSTRKIKLFDHNKFLIKKIFYPHVLHTSPLVCDLHDKQRTNCKIVPHDEAESNHKLVTIDQKITKKELFGKFIYTVQEMVLTQKERKDVKGNVHKQLTLYISNQDGSNINRLHPKDQYVIDSRWLPKLKRYYFTTRTDSNNNQVIDSKDKQFSYMIDFNNSKPTAKQYLPF